MQSNTVNVKDLPATQEVINGDYIIIEKQTGSHIIDFRDFVVGPTNTSFYNALVTNLKAVSTYAISLSSLIDRNTTQTIRAVQANFESLTAAFSLAVPKWFIYESDLPLAIGERVSFDDFVSRLATIEVQNIVVNRQPYDFVPGDNNPLKPFLFGCNIINQFRQGDAIFYTYRMSLTSLSAYNTDVNFKYCVTKAYY